MREQFNSLEPEKQERIINAALREFARSGYEKASTNAIIKEANIAKGSLFNYFNSKKDLYLSLFDYVSKVIDEIYTQIDWNETDLFERLKQFGLVKFKVYKKYPQAYDFLKSAAHENAPEIKPEINTVKNELVEDGLEKSYKNIDFTKFREDMDLDKIMNIITLTILGLAEQHRDKVESFEDIDSEVLNEFDQYFDILKQCFYKEEEQ